MHIIYFSSCYYMYIHSIKHKPAIQNYIQKNNPHKKSGISMTSSLFHPCYVNLINLHLFLSTPFTQKNHSLKQVPDSLSQRWTHCYLRQRGQSVDDYFDEKLCFGGDELVEKGLKKVPNKKTLWIYVTGFMFIFVQYVHIYPSFVQTMPAKVFFGLVSHWS